MSNYKLPKSAVIALTIMMSSTVVNADPVTINVTGNIIASPCVVNAGSNTLNVSLGDIQAASLATAGAASSVVNFDLKMTECPSGTTSAGIVFSGTEDPDAGSNYYKNTGTAKNVAVALIEKSTGYFKGNGQNMSRNVAADGSITYELQAKAYSVAGGAMPGTIQSAITVAITYK